MGQATSMLMQPDWVMLGVKLPESARREAGMESARVMVIASQTLTQAELRAALEHVGWDRWSAEPGSFIKSYEMSAYMRDVHVAYGADYAGAMRTIFERWSPDATAKNNREGLAHARPAAIDSGRPALMPPRR